MSTTNLKIQDRKGAASNLALAPPFFTAVKNVLLELPENSGFSGLAIGI